MQVNSPHTPGAGIEKGFLVTEHADVRKIDVAVIIRISFILWHWLCLMLHITAERFFLIFIARNCCLLLSLLILQKLVLLLIDFAV